LEQLTIEEAETVRKNEKKHRPDALISFIGIGGVRIYDINSKAFPLITGDMILLTTDGLTNSISDNDILNSLLIKTEITESLNALLHLAAQNANGVQDNTTCVLIKV
jgi:protein phosphatase